MPSADKRRIVVPILLILLALSIFSACVIYFLNISMTISKIVIFALAAVSVLILVIIILLFALQVHQERLELRAEAKEEIGLKQTKQQHPNVEQPQPVQSQPEQQLSQKQMLQQIEKLLQTQLELDPEARSKLIQLKESEKKWQELEEQRKQKLAPLTEKLEENQKQLKEQHDLLTKQREQIAKMWHQLTDLWQLYLQHFHPQLVQFLSEQKVERILQYNLEVLWKPLLIYELKKKWGNLEKNWQELETQWQEELKRQEEQKKSGLQIEKKQLEEQQNSLKNFRIQLLQMRKQVSVLWKLYSEQPQNLSQKQLLEHNIEMLRELLKKYNSEALSKLRALYISIKTWQKLEEEHYQKVKERFQEDLKKLSKQQEELQKSSLPTEKLKKKQTLLEERLKLLMREQEKSTEMLNKEIKIWQDHLGQLLKQSEPESELESESKPEQSPSS